MTHDELLEKIDSKEGNLNFYALRAVMELHEPGEYQFNDQPVSVCNHCQLGVVGDSYPCETIQAIEKELG